jgi:hypothetical protein
MKKTFILAIGMMTILVLNAQEPQQAKTPKNDPSISTYLVDSVEMPYDQVIKINTNLIESMNVFKGPDAVAKFGIKYKNGLVLIKLKKAKK